MNLTRTLQAPQPKEELKATVSLDPIMRSTVTHDEAVRLVRSVKKKTIFLYISMPIKNADAITSEPYRVCTHLQVSKAGALKFLEAFGSDARRNGIVRMAVCSDCLFIG